MRVLAILLSVGSVFYGATATAREWMSRSGTHRIEAELVEVGSDDVLLKRDDNGKLVRVPFSQLSLADVLFARESKNAPSKGKGKGESTSDSSTPKPVVEPETTPRTTATPSPAGIAKSQPPLAREGESGWQAAPAPPPADWTARPIPQLNIPIPSQEEVDDDIVLFPGPASPFVVVGNNDYGEMREVWDLRSARRIGAIREQIQIFNRLAISPHGERMAVYSLSPGRIDIWSFKTGKRERQISLPQPDLLLYGLIFVGPDRIATSNPYEKHLSIWSAQTGELLRTVEIGLDSEHLYALSPDGSYVAVARDEMRVELIDFRNGVSAGKPKSGEKEQGEYEALDPEAIDFSADGSEFAVVARSRSERNPRLFCWSMLDGSLLVEHKLGAEFESAIEFDSITKKARETRIQWVPGGRGWILCGVAFVDRATGVPVLLAKSRQLPCRVVDDKQVLLVSGDRKQRSLVSTDIPWKKIDETVRVVRSGGSSSDVGLPALTTPDRSALVRRDFGAEVIPYRVVDWAAKVALPSSPKLDLGGAIQNVETTVVAANQAHLLLVNGGAPESMPRRDGAPASVSNVYDLNTGKQLLSVTPPFKTKLADFSPSGRLAVFVDQASAKRLDIVDMHTKRPVLAFKPYGESSSLLDGTTHFVGFPDDQHLATLNLRGEFVLWRIAGCQAVYSMDLGSGSMAFFDRSRQYLAAGSRNGELRLFEPLTGKSCGVLSPPLQDGSTVMTGAFRQDGQQLAAVFARESYSRLVVWNLTNQAVLCDLPLYYNVMRVRWSGLNYVSLLNTQTSIQDHEYGRHFQETLIDLPAKRVAWNYLFDLGAEAADGPDDRCWYFAPNAQYEPRQIHAITLPDSKANDYLTAASAPRPLFASGLQVALDVKIGSLPDGVEDYRQREDAMAQQLREHFTKELEKRGLRIAPMADVTFRAVVKRLTQEEILLVRSRRVIDDAAFVLSTATVYAQLQLATKDGISLWLQEECVQPGSEPSRQERKGLPPSVARQLIQWEKARQWCLEVPLPVAVYHPDAYKGVGESLLTASGPKFRRQHSRSDK